MDYWCSGYFGNLKLTQQTEFRAFSFIHRVIAYIMKIKLKYINMRVSIRWDELQMGLDLIPFFRSGVGG